MRNHWLMNKAGEGDGTGSGSLLSGNTGGGTGEAPKGGTTTPNAAGNAPAPTGADSGGTKGNEASDWRSALPDDLRENPALKIIHDVPSLVKSYLNAQKMVGADKIVIPGKHATPDDWKQVYSKLGLPADLKEYEVKMEEGLSIDKEFVGKFKETAHANGILPHQAQALADWFAKVNKDSETMVENDMKAKAKADDEALRKEWGAAYDQELGKARKVISEINDPSFNKFLVDAGIDANVNLIKFFNKIANKFMKEDAVVGGDQPAGKYTPQDAQKEVNRILSNMSGPYYNSDHPGHKAAVQEVADLMEMAYPRKTS